MGSACAGAGGAQSELSLLPGATPEHSGERVSSLLGGSGACAWLLTSKWCPPRPHIEAAVHWVQGLPDHAGGLAAPGDAQLRALRQQQLADLQHARQRQKQTLLRQQLWQSLCVHHEVHMEFGHAAALEHIFSNPGKADAEFELCVSHPAELQPVPNEREWQHLAEHRRLVSAGGTDLESLVLPAQCRPSLLPASQQTSRSGQLGSLAELAWSTPTVASLPAAQLSAA